MITSYEKRRSPPQQLDHQMLQTLSKAQGTQDIDYFDSFNVISSKQKLRQVLKFWSNFSLVLFGKRREIHTATLTKPCYNFDKSMYQLRGIHVLILTNPCNNLEKSKYQFRQINATTHTHTCNNFDKSNLNKIKKTLTQSRSDGQGKAMIGLGSDENAYAQFIQSKYFEI